MTVNFDNQIVTSVIIPCYKNTKWLDQAISSAINQATPQTEVIVVDDGNPNSQVEKICESFKSPLISYIKSEHRGSSGARNVGLSAAKGRYIKFLDADDTIIQGSLLQQIEALERTKSDAIYSDWRIERIVFKSIPLRYDTVSGAKKIDLLAAIIRKDWLPIGCLLYRREIIDQIGGWDERFTINDDFVFNVKLLASGATFHYEPILSQTYRRHTHYSLSSTFSTSKSAVWSYLNSVYETLKYLESHNIHDLNSSIREAMAWQYLWLANRWYEFDRAFSLGLKQRSKDLKSTTNKIFQWHSLERLMPKSTSIKLCQISNQSWRVKNRLLERLYITDLLAASTFPLKKTISCLKAIRRNWLS